MSTRQSAMVRFVRMCLCFHVLNWTFRTCNHENSLRMTLRGSLRLGVGIAVALALWVVTATGQQVAPALSYVPGEVIVKFKPGTSTPRRNAVLAKRNARLVRKFQALDIH